MTAPVDVLAPRFPGPWTVRNEQAWGFEITRALGGGESEWMVDETGAIAVFDTEQEAIAALEGAK